MKFTTRKLAVMAMLVAVSVVLVYLIRFPIFPAVAFLEYDPADIPILIGAFAFGPVAGLILTVIASAVQALTVSASSGLYGFIMHVIATGTLTVSASVIYRRLHTKKGAVVALICGTVAMGLIMMVANHIITPFFMSAGGSVEETRAFVDTLLLPFILPFNLIKAGANSAVTFFVYKTVSVHIIKNENLLKKKS